MIRLNNKLICLRIGEFIIDTIILILIFNKKIVTAYLSIFETFTNLSTVFPKISPT